MVPHLVTALNGPLLELEKTIIDSTPATKDGSGWNGRIIRRHFIVRSI